MCSLRVNRGSGVGASGDEVLVELRHYYLMHHAALYLIH
jgi:hypothetical protein